MNNGRVDGSIVEAFSSVMRMAQTSPLETNLLAAMCADAIAAGKDKRELEAASRFLQLLTNALRAYY